MKIQTIFIIAFCVYLGGIPLAHTETIFIENKKGSDTMILRTKPQNTEPRPQRDYLEEGSLLIAPSIHYQSKGRPYFPKPRPPHHNHPSLKPSRPEAPNAPYRPYRPVTPRE